MPIDIMYVVAGLAANQDRRAGHTVSLLLLPFFRMITG